jgi:type IV pilus assembly protein PilC
MAQSAALGQVPFNWEGTDRTGKKIKGKVVAASETAVRAELRRQGVTPTRVRKQSMIFRAFRWCSRSTSSARVMKTPRCRS